MSHRLPHGVRAHIREHAPMTPGGKLHPQHNPNYDVDHQMEPTPSHLIGQHKNFAGHAFPGYLPGIPGIKHPK